jgi:hypothetical protein
MSEIVIHRCCSAECSEAHKGKAVVDDGNPDPRCTGTVFMHESDPRFPADFDGEKDERGWATVPCGKGLAIERAPRRRRF